MMVGTEFKLEPCNMWKCCQIAKVEKGLGRKKKKEEEMRNQEAGDQVREQKYAAGPVIIVSDYFFTIIKIRQG